MDRRTVIPDLEIDQARKSAALRQISRAVEEKRITAGPNYLHVLLGQISYISTEFWIGHGISVLMAAVLFVLPGKGGEKADLMMAWASVLAAVIGFAGVWEINRNLVFHMAELEQGCYLNLGQIWGIKMVVSGCIDICILTGLIAGLAVETRYNVFALSMYLLVPFVFSNACYLFLLYVGRNPRRKWLQASLAVFMGVAAVMLTEFPKVYRAVYLPVWAAAFAVGLILLGTEIYFVLHRSLRGGEKLCWN